MLSRKRGGRWRRGAANRRERGVFNAKVTLVTGVTVSVCRWGWCCTAVPGRCLLGNTSEGCPISAPGRDSRGGRREEGRMEGGRRREEG